MRLLRTAVLLGGFLARSSAEMPGEAVVDASGETTITENQASDFVTIEDEEPVRRMRKEHGVYVEYVDGERTDRGLSDLKGTKMTWGEGSVRTYNRTIVDMADHPGKAYVESIKVFDINHAKSQEYTEALKQFYAEFAPEKIDQVPQIIRTFDNEEAKLFEALENKYGSRPTFDVAELRYDFSEHKQYAWQDKEHEFWYLQACVDLDRIKALHKDVVKRIQSPDHMDIDHNALLAGLHATDETAALHREGMTYAMWSAGKQMDMIRAVHQNTWKYYQIAVELVVEHREIYDQLKASEQAHAAVDGEDDDAAAAAATASDTESAESSE